MERSLSSTVRRSVPLSPNSQIPEDCSFVHSYGMETFTGDNV